MKNIEQTHMATLTNPDGTPLTPLQRIAAVVWMEAYYQDCRSGLTKLTLTRAKHAQMLGLLSYIQRSEGLVDV